MLLAAACVAAAVALHPALAAQYLSDDGVLAPSSRRALFVVEATLVAVAAGSVLVWRRWRTPTMRRERIALGSAAIVGSVVISAIGAEAGLTLIHRYVKPLGAERHYFFQYDPVLGWKHRPESRATFKNALVRIDADGLRVSGRERGPFHSRVLLLGDSQAFGDGVAAEDTFAARLEADMPGLRVLNASVIGYGTDQQLLYFEREGRQYAPEFTLVTLNAYDLRDNLSARVRSGYAKPRFITSPAGLTLTNVPVPGDGPVDRFHRELQYRSHLYRLLTRLGKRADRQSGDESIPPAQRLAAEIYPEGAQLEHGLELIGAILDRMTESAGRAGSRLIVLFLPYQMDFAGPPTYLEHTERLVSLLRQRAAANSFTFLDGRSRLAADRDRVFIDAMHLSPEGHRRIAGLLEETLAASTRASRTHER
jgi:hypothetical protein